jgi:hypothetical protein
MVAINTPLNANSITNPLTGEVVTPRERAHAATTLACTCAAAAVERAEAVTARAHAPLKKAQEYLQRARNHWRRAVSFGASPAQVQAIVEAGKAAAEAVAKAEALVAQSTAEAATRKLKQARAVQLKGMNVIEAVRHVAEALIVSGHTTHRTEGVHKIAALVDPPTATPDLILNAWMTLDPGAY